MTKIPLMTRTDVRADCDFRQRAADPLEPTQPLSPRTGHSPFPLPLPIVRPWFPAALVLKSGPQGLARVA